MEITMLFYNRITQNPFCHKPCSFKKIMRSQCQNVFRFNTLQTRLERQYSFIFLFITQIISSFFTTFYSLLSNICNASILYLLVNIYTLLLLSPSLQAPFLNFFNLYFLSLFAYLYNSIIVFSYYIKDLILCKELYLIEN